MKLYLREKSLHFTDSLIQLVETLLNLAKGHTETVMPGFTHYQHATISTFGHLLVSYAQALERDLERFELTYSIINRNPLGSAAGYGTSWNLDRELTTKLLGFDEVQENSIDCVSSRWEAEAELASAISFMMTHLSIFCQDIIFMTTSEANMIRLDDKFVGGSSIMPQKRNPAPLEVTRAKTAIAHGIMQAIFEIAKASLSGYNRDSQYTKYLIFDLVAECELAPVVIREVTKTMQVNRDVMRRLATVGFLNAVDVADYLTREFKIPFRQAYHIVADAVKLSDKGGEISLSALNEALKADNIELPIGNSDFEHLSIPEMNVRLKSHIGGPAPQAVLNTIDTIAKKVAKHKIWLESTNSRLNNARAELAKYRDEILN